MAETNFQSPQQEFMDRELGKERDLSAAKSITELLAILRLRSETPSQPAIQQQTVPNPHPFLAVTAPEIQNPFIPDSVHQTRLERFKEFLGDHVVELKQLKESNGIEKYHEKFEVLSARVNLSEASLVSIFLDGLWTDTRMNIEMFNPQTIRHCLVVGRLYERVHPKKPTIGQLINTERIKKTVKASESIPVDEDLSGIKDNSEAIQAEMMKRDETNPTVWPANVELIGGKEASVNMSKAEVVNQIWDICVEEDSLVLVQQTEVVTAPLQFNSVSLLNETVALESVILGSNTCEKRVDNNVEQKSVFHECLQLQREHSTRLDLKTKARPHMGSWWLSVYTNRIWDPGGCLFIVDATVEFFSVLLATTIRFFSTLWSRFFKQGGFDIGNALYRVSNTWRVEIRRQIQGLILIGDKQKKVALKQEDTGNQS